MPEIFIARQPIFNRKLRVVGYEMLYRDCMEAQRARISDPDKIASQVILNIFTDIGIERLSEGKKAYINVNRRFLIDGVELPIPAKRVVLEVLEDVEPTPDIVKAVRSLSDRGFTIAVDDVVDPGDIEELLPLVGIVKFDLMKMDLSRLEEYSDYIKSRGIDILGEKIETIEIFERCRELGFDYFQGFFLSKPKVIRGNRISGSRGAILTALAEIHSPSIDFQKLEMIIQRDASLSYMLLRLVNSVYYGIRMEVKSIMGALTMLGIDEIRSWLSLLVISKIDDNPGELINIALVRARMCEFLVEKKDPKLAGSGFLAGLFTVLEVLLGTPIREITEELPLSDSVKKALIDREGTVGEVLKGVLAYENGDWEKVEELEMEPAQVSDSYLEALDWTREVNSILA
ncbi:MAG: HDOD domain-containing protein [Candidatus Latescibacteria bacterium]|nr:HDOD domain-containing protein [bacterium]MBD3422856.1 HDOD domain-containing protein [Candidatus Latescibacterota bacterium]